MWNLAFSYAKGKGVPQSEEKTLKWLRLAAEAGSDKAAEALREIEGNNEYELDRHEKASVTRPNKPSKVQAENIMLSIKNSINPISAGAFALFILSGCMSTTSQTSKVSNGYNEYSNAPIGCPQSETSKALGEAAEVIGLSPTY